MLILYILISSSYIFKLTQSRALPRNKRAFSYIANETVCMVDNVIFHDGDPIPTDDPCESCKCRPPGFSCVLRECLVKPGCKAIRREGECCLEYQCGCEHNGKFFNDGDRIPNAESPCYSCYCQGSSITCALADCKFRFDCEPEYVVGECCPRYEHCQPEASWTPTTKRTLDRNKTNTTPSTTKLNSLTTSTTKLTTIVPTKTFLQTTAQPSKATSIFSISPSISSQKAEESISSTAFETKDIAETTTEASNILDEKNISLDKSRNLTSIESSSETPTISFTVTEISLMSNANSNENLSDSKTLNKEQIETSTISTFITNLVSTSISNEETMTTLSSFSTSNSIPTFTMEAAVDIEVKEINKNESSIINPTPAINDVSFQVHTSKIKINDTKHESIETNELINNSTDEVINDETGTTSINFLFDTSSSSTILSEYDSSKVKIPEKNERNNSEISNAESILPLISSTQGSKLFDKDLFPNLSGNSSDNENETLETWFNMETMTTLTSLLFGERKKVSSFKINKIKPIGDNESDIKISAIVNEVSEVLESLSKDSKTSLNSNVKDDSKNLPLQDELEDEIYPTTLTWMTDKELLAEHKSISDELSESEIPFDSDNLFNSTQTSDSHGFNSSIDEKRIVN